MINLIPIPSCLDKTLINDWFESFAEELIEADYDDCKKVFLFCDGNVAFVNSEQELFSRPNQQSINPSLAFSDEIEYRDYPDIIEEILMNWPQLTQRSIDEIEQLICNHDGENDGKYEAISGIICRDLHLEYDDVVETIKDILNSAVHLKNHLSSMILGKYLPRDDLIILYVRAIETLSKHSKNTLLQLYEEVFIHELLHWFNYSLMRVQNKEKELMNRFDYTASAVKESLAAFFELKYCLSHKIKPEFWDDVLINSVCSYPYSGAKHIISWDHFKEVLTLTGSDLDLSLRTLLDTNPRAFYSIKNSYSVIYKNSNPKKPNSVVVQQMSQGKTKPKIILIPEDKKLFKQKLLVQKAATLIWIYKDSKRNCMKIWRATRFSKKSNLINNIRTKSEFDNDLLEVIAIVY